MIAQKVPVDQIDLPKTDPQFRTLCKAFIVQLADSINVDGLVQPVVLRLNPSASGRYLLICGRHRYHAVAKVLKHTSIDAVVRDDLDETAAERLTLAENLLQSPLNMPQRQRSSQRWHQSYLTWFDGTFGRGSQAGVSGAAKNGRLSLSRGHDDDGY